MRLIDADALYKKVTEKYCDIVAGRYPFNIVAYDMAEMVKNSPTVEPARGEWIPCSERLPEEDGMYLITSDVLGSKEIQCVLYQNMILHDFISSGKAVAWMPLPEPYERKKV